MRSRTRAAARLGLVLAIVGAVSPAIGRTQEAARRDVSVVVRAGALSPSVVTIEADARVRFLNASGRRIHVELLGRAGQHHLFAVSGTLWADFHSAGRHPYVVHVEDGGRLELRGTVIVADAPASAVSAMCGWITVEGNCIEP